MDKMKNLGKFLEDMRTAEGEQERKLASEDEKGRSHYTLFFPMDLKDKVLSMTAKSVKLSEVMKTVVIGTLSPRYTNQMYERDIEEITEIFGLHGEPIDISGLKEIRIRQLPNDPRAIDSKKAAEDVKALLQEINLNKDVDAIRIIQIGPSFSNFDYQAIEYLLREWTPNGSKKLLQFITQGDTAENAKLMFSRSLVVKGLVSEVQFMNTQDYHPFGIYLQPGKALAD